MAAMTASLEWLLAQHDLGLRLVAGVPGCEQRTWAHASDLVDPTPWLTGGELVLTTGIGLPRAAGVYLFRAADGRVVRSAADAPIGTELHTMLADGNLVSRVLEQQGDGDGS